MTTPITETTAKNRRIHEELFGLCCHDWTVTGGDNEGYVLSAHYTCSKCNEKKSTSSRSYLPTVPNYCSDLVAMQSIIDKMAEPGMHDKERGHWLDIHSPFRPGDRWFGGFTPHGETGWNGRADYRTEQGSDTMPLAVVDAAIAYLDRAKDAAP